MAKEGSTKKEAADPKQRREKESQEKIKEKEIEKERRKLFAEGKQTGKRKRVQEEAAVYSAHRKLPVQTEEEDQVASVTHSKRSRQLLAQFQDSDSESDDGILCALCGQTARWLFFTSYVLD